MVFDVCVKQTADKTWTMGQSIFWSIRDILKETEGTGLKYKMRVRVKVDKKGDIGNAFSYAHAYFNMNDWAGDNVQLIAIPAQAVNNREWQWYELPDVIEYRPDVRQIVYVVAENNPENVSAIYVDTFELVPVTEK
ncbi:hypothetical protein B9J78_05950 [bacterium Unc6]|nr:hypothetical protein [bacterium Unc6]